MHSISHNEEIIIIGFEVLFPCLHGITCVMDVKNVLFHQQLFAFGIKILSLVIPFERQNICFATLFVNTTL